jgi:hypothetical protein
MEKSDSMDLPTQSNYKPAAVTGTDSKDSKKDSKDTKEPKDPKKRRSTSAKEVQDRKKEERGLILLERMTYFLLERPMPKELSWPIISDLKLSRSPVTELKDTSDRLGHVWQTNIVFAEHVILTGSEVLLNLCTRTNGKNFRHWKPSTMGTISPEQSQIKTPYNLLVQGQIESVFLWTGKSTTHGGSSFRDW